MPLASKMVLEKLICFSEPQFIISKAEIMTTTQPLSQHTHTHTHTGGLAYISHSKHLVIVVASVVLVNHYQLWKKEEKENLFS